MPTVAADKDLRVTVAICTWNRCSSLEQTLEGFTRLEAPTDASWELVVVNNNCTDRTDAVIRAFEGRLPVRRVFEPKPGLSHARNRGVSEATGDYILWTDDDVTVCREWLIEYVNAFRRWPAAAIFGGPIQPWFDGTPPAWLLEIYPTVAGVYAARDFGPEPVSLSAHVIPWGANYAVRAVEQARHPYDPDLGYRPGRMIGWEETEVIQALLADGNRRMVGARGRAPPPCAKASTDDEILAQSLLQPGHVLRQPLERDRQASDFRPAALVVEASGRIRGEVPTAPNVVTT